MMATLQLTDLSGQKRFETDLEGDIRPQHTVRQAVETYLDANGIPENGLRWAVFSRGLRLDMKSRIADLKETDTEWTVVPEVSAGAGRRP